MAIIETLTADQVQPHTATSRHHAGPVVQVTWVDWEAPADTWTAVAKQIGVGVLTWAEGQGPTSAVPVLYLDQEDGSAERIGLGEIVRIETPHGEAVGMTQADIDTAIANPDSQNPPAPEWPPSLSKGPAWQEQEAAEDRQPITITVLSDPDDPTSVDATVTWDPRWPDMIDTDQAERMLHLDRNTACRYRDALDTVIRRASRYAGQEG